MRRGGGWSGIGAAELERNFGENFQVREMCKGGRVIRFDFESIMQ